ncbi:ribosome small subunit-dependent GTPase A [Yanghanlia caeni]|uniref:Small ribosomal subunit biogenesis GTPase RsgA n=1 Tax=Yanghanlia caeni TaxID=3064283 RepID=A0ABU1D386_9BURK|nr:ribosome small subunit-dependent GTPase A [Alcaligenaceae bacterium LG-2]NGR09450.1 ribosome small subunit-dependent GTPase A [bacterium SGD-2]HZH56296.1 ribosome small subunit-dependent GTPase A [Burkholderiaceae bacterium]
MPSTKPTRPAAHDTARRQGRIVSSHGRHYMVELDDGSLRQCFPRGKRSDAAVGDHVVVSLQGEEGSIERILPRKNLLYRSDELRTKQFAANVDRLLIVVAPEPPFSDDLAGRALVGAWSAGIEPIIVLNKADLPSVAEARERLTVLRELGVPVVETNATDAEATQRTLLPLLKGRCTLLLGQSAMGKSTILNALVPDANAATQEHSQALSAGRHTTTYTRLYHLPQGGELIDSPGFQAFGLNHLERDDILRGFPEFKAFIEHCRFYNCSHRHEPGCGVQQALEHGKITAERHALYTRLIEELEARTLY